MISVSELVDHTLITTIGQGVFQGYQVGDDLLQSQLFFREYKGKDLRPYIYGASVEYSVARHLSRLPGMRCFQEANAGNTSNFVLMMTSEGLLISVSRVRTSTRRPRPANYRKVLASLNEQWLIPEAQPIQYRDAKNYVIVAHGKDASVGRLFCTIGLPFGDSSSWIDSLHIDDYLLPPQLAPEELIELQADIAEKTKENLENGADLARGTG